MSNNNSEIVATAEQNEETKNYTIHVKDKPNFPCDFESCCISTSDLAKRINAVFGSVLADYRGCYVYLNNGNVRNNPVVAKVNPPIGHVCVDLYFSDGGNKSKPDGIKVLKVLRSIAKEANDATKRDPNNLAANIGARFMAQTQQSSLCRSGNIFEVDETLYQMLEAFRFDPRVHQNVRPTRWNDLKTEIIQSMNPTTADSEALVCIGCLDAVAIINEIYGTVDGNKKYAYKIEPMTPIYHKAGEHILMVTKMDTEVIARVASQLSVNTVNSIGFYSC